MVWDVKITQQEGALFWIMLYASLVRRRIEEIDSTDWPVLILQIFNTQFFLSQRKIDHLSFQLFSRCNSHAGELTTVMGR